MHLSTARSFFQDITEVDAKGRGDKLYLTIGTLSQLALKFPLFRQLFRLFSSFPNVAHIKYKMAGHGPVMVLVSIEGCDSAVNPRTCSFCYVQKSNEGTKSNSTFANPCILLPPAHTHSHTLTHAQRTKTPKGKQDARHNSVISPLQWP